MQFPLIPSWGGAEEQTLLLAQGLRKSGYHLQLTSSNRALVHQFQERKFKSKKLWMGYEPTSVRSLFLFPLTFTVALFQFLILMIVTRPHAVFCLSFTDKLVATPFAKLVGARVIWIEHTRLGRWFYKNPLLPWYRLMSHLVKIVAPSYFLRNQLIAGGVNPDRIIVIYPGIPLSHLGEGGRRPGEAGRKIERVFRIGFLGRLSEEKGVDVLINVLKNLPSTTALIAGTGPAEESLKKLTIKLGTVDQVEFVGFVEDKEKFFQSIDMLIVPSVKAESFGLVIVEAMRAGIPVIASRIGAIPEIIEHKKTGLLFEPGNTQALVDLINMLQSGSSLKDSLINQAKQTVEAKFGVKKMIEEFKSLIHDS